MPAGSSFVLTATALRCPVVVVAEAGLATPTVMAAAAASAATAAVAVRILNICGLLTLVAGLADIDNFGANQAVHPSTKQPHHRTIALPPNRWTEPAPIVTAAAYPGDESDLGVDRLDPAVREAVLDRGEDRGLVFHDPALQVDECPDSAAAGPADPDVEVEGRKTLVPRVLLFVTLAGPAPSGSADPSRRCRGCSHPLRHLPDQAAPSFTVPAATGPAAKVSHLRSNRQRLVAHEDPDTARPRRRPCR